MNSTVKTRQEVERKNIMKFINKNESCHVMLSFVGGEVSMVVYDLEGQEHYICTLLENGELVLHYNLPEEIFKVDSKGYIKTKKDE